MNSFEMDGKIVQIGEVKQVTDKFRTREFVVKTEEQYPQYVKFQFVNDGVDNLNSFNVDQLVKVKFSLSGRESKGVYYTNLNAYGIYLIADSNLKPLPNSPEPAPVKPDQPIQDIASDELPF